MCNIGEALAVCCLFLNTVDCIIFSLIPKLVNNLDPKALKEPTNFVKDYTFGINGGLGQVLTDGTSSLPLIGNSLGSATNFGPSKDEFLSGNFGIEIPFQNAQKSQNDMEIPSPFNLGLLPSNTGQVLNFEGPRPAFRSNFNDFDDQTGKVSSPPSLSNGQSPSDPGILNYQTGKIPPPPNLPNGQPPSNFRNLDYKTEKVSPPLNFPNGKPPSQGLGFNEIENNSNQVPISSSNFNGPLCDSGKQSINNEDSSLKNESPPILPTSRFLKMETLPKGPIATVKITGDIYLNSDSFSLKPTSS